VPPLRHCLAAPGRGPGTAPRHSIYLIN
jgi:hypothetical protein